MSVKWIVNPRRSWSRKTVSARLQHMWVQELGYLRDDDEMFPTQLQTYHSGWWGWALHKWPSNFRLRYDPSQGHKSSQCPVKLLDSQNKEMTEDKDPWRGSPHQRSPHRGSRRSSREHWANLWSRNTASSLGSTETAHFLSWLWSLLLHVTVLTFQSSLRSIHIPKTSAATVPAGKVLHSRHRLDTYKTHETHSAQPWPTRKLANQVVNTDIIPLYAHGSMQPPRRCWLLASLQKKLATQTNKR